MAQLPFQRISSEQYWDKIERVADSIRCVSPDTSENETMLEETTPTPSVGRRPGRPRMQRTLDTLPDSAAVAAVEAIQRNQNAGQGASPAAQVKCSTGPGELEFDSEM
ncbi:hypothetical protein R1sor_025380 [Riccia sorocarpa]|uniref:Uncharacterized protein n=1 Tax=Riccia sorocarpa TaxID=122646 RepID=A0ABD3GA08_9MARC